jgi:hypothetical protein
MNAKPYGSVRNAVAIKSIEVEGWFYGTERSLWAQGVIDTDKE